MLRNSERYLTETKIMGSVPRCLSSGQPSAVACQAKTRNWGNQEQSGGKKVALPGIEPGLTRSSTTTWSHTTRPQHLNCWLVVSLQTDDSHIESWASHVWIESIAQMDDNRNYQPYSTLVRYTLGTDIATTWLLFLSPGFPICIVVRHYAQYSRAPAIFRFHIN